MKVSYKTGLRGMVGILLCCGFVAEGMAQNLQGRVTNPQKEPLPGSNIYIRETMQGVAANEQGEFQLTLSPGAYTCEISAIGYEKRMLSLRLDASTQVLEVVMQPMSYMLPEVFISAKGEDPALYIMRRAISRAPLHRNQVDSYRAEIYTKGQGKVGKIPRLYLLGLSAEERREVNRWVGKLLLLESVTEVSFRAPEQYENKVLALSSTLPQELDPENVLGIITESIYDPEVMGLISPLSPGAFSQYHFRHESSYLQDNRAVYVIRVEPRRKNSQLFTGTLHIEDAGWSVVRFDLAAERLGIGARFKATFNEVKENIFLPTSYDISMDAKVIGLAATGKYYSSLKYSDVQAAAVQALAPQAFGEQVALTGRQEKAMRRLEELSEKESLTTREAYRMARLTQEMLEEARRSDSIPRPEVRDFGSGIRVEADTLALQRDSLYWRRLRTIPLNADEKQSYREIDSLRQRSIFRSDTAVYSGQGARWISNLVAGGVFRPGKRVQWHISGLLGAFPEYNTVDGLWVGQRMRFTVGLDKYRRLEIHPSVHYGIARHHWMWEVEAVFPYRVGRNGQLTLQVGDRSLDYKQRAGGWRTENSVSTLFAGDNFMRFYRGRYLHLFNSIALFDGMIFRAWGRYQDRSPLDNATDYAFFNRTVSENLLNLPGVPEMASHRSLLFGGELRYYLGSDFPTFRVSYERAVPVESSGWSDYLRIGAGIRQDVGISLFSRLSWEVDAGRFFSVGYLPYPDWKHVGTTGWFFNTDRFRHHLVLGGYYPSATDDRWLHASLNFRSSYLLFKNIPALQSLPFDEALHLRYLWTPRIRNYLEAGYSVGLGSMTRLALFVGFDRLSYDRIGLRLYFPLDRLY